MESYYPALYGEDQWPKRPLVLILLAIIALMIAYLGLVYMC